jgi:hypothetical protein
VARVWSEVCRPLMTSTSFMTGTGFMKCMPMTLSDLLVELASSVMEMEEVLLAMMASGFNTLSRDERRDFLTLAF